MDETVIENCPLPITDDAIASIPAIATLCHHFKSVIDMGYLETSYNSQFSMSAKLHMSVKDFQKMLEVLNTKVKDKEAQDFFDYLIHHKLQLYKKLYPHLHLKTIKQNDGKSQKDLFRSVTTLAVIPQKITYTDFIVFF